MGLFDKIRNVFKKSDDSIKYDIALSKTRGEFISKLGNLSKKYKFISDDYFEELEDILIMADIGIETVLKFVDLLKKRVKEENIKDSESLKEIIVDELFIMYVDNDIIDNKVHFNSDDVSLILFVGVNGVGKTTSIGKMARLLKSGGKKVLLVAGDTFRAGAREQLIEWGKRVSVDVYHNDNKDPSSVIYGAIDYARENKYDVLLVDTAGRLQNKVNLMQELSKINKIIKSKISSYETLLVVDSTTGQNGISQAKSFKEITSVDGIILTKLDGTAKGGIVLAIKDELKLAVKYVGLGEGMDDLEVFDIEKYIYGLFKDLV